MKFVKILFLLFTTGLIVSCSNLKAPEYVGVGEVKFSKIVNDSITIKAALNFKNPNRLGGKLVLDNLHAEVNKIDLGFLKRQSVRIPSKKDFSVPLEIKLSYGQIFDSKNGLLGTLLNSILTNAVEVRFNGDATFKKFLMNKKYSIQFSEKVKIIK
ncbi:hypothetical protein ACXGQW_12045 [Wenyingzhuangia sp. IMCC45533]